MIGRAPARAIARTMTLGLLPGILLLWSAIGAAAQETVSQSFSFGAAAPSRGVLVDVPNARITVDGWPGDSARVELTPAGPRTRPLPVISLANGRLVVADRGNQESLEVIVRVPSDVDLRVHGSNGGPVTITGVHGALEIENSNAGIFIEGSRGGVAASTSNGPIVAVVEGVPPLAPMSFLTSNNFVRIVLPADSDLNVYLETDNAAVRSEFDVRTEDTRGAPAPGHARVLRGRLGQGGAVLRVRTDNGDIVLERGPATAPLAPVGGDRGG